MMDEVQSRLDADAEVICGACADSRHEDCSSSGCDCTHRQQQREAEGAGHGR